MRMNLWASTKGYISKHNVIVLWMIRSESKYCDLNWYHGTPSGTGEQRVGHQFEITVLPALTISNVRRSGVLHWKENTLASLLLKQEKLQILVEHVLFVSCFTCKGVILHTQSWLVLTHSKLHYK